MMAEPKRSRSTLARPGCASTAIMPSASLQQRRCHRPNSRTDIDDERAGDYGRVSDELPCPSGVELVPCPAPLSGAHGGGP